MRSHSLLPLSLIFLLSPSNVLCQTPNGTISCSQSNNKIQAATLQLESDCGLTQFCNSQGQCQDKGCRKDEFPLGYGKAQDLPPRCPKGQFCPDEEDACQDLIPVGQPCQLNRDDQCQPPDNWSELAGTLSQNFNGSICLMTQCMFANITENNNCVIDNTEYHAYYPNGSDFIYVTSRGNCQKDLYCDSQTAKCIKKKDVGITCDADKECVSNNCGTGLTCGQPADAPHHFAVWVYALVAIAIIGGMIGTLVGLYFIHSRDRDQDREKRMQYWREQNTFRQNIMQMRETARSSMMSYSRDGTLSNRSSRYGLNTEDSQTPMLPAKGSPSGLRNQISEDDLESPGELPAGDKRRRKLSRKMSTGKGSSSNRI